VRQTLDRVAGSASERDVAGVAAHLAADYRDAAGNGRSDVEQTLRGYFAAYESLDVSLRDVSVERAEGAARARFRADLSGRPRKEAAGLAGLLPSSSSYRFDVRLVPDGTKWRIAWAAWEQVQP
jgi:anti-sigma factor RsiW